MSSLGMHPKLYTSLLIIALAFPGAAVSHAAVSHAAVSQQKAETAPPPQGAQEIMLTVTVTDKQGRAIRNLSKDGFAIQEEKKPQEITSFAYIDEPLSVGILLDTSTTIRTRFKYLPDVLREHLGFFTKQSHPLNEYFIMTFTDQPHLLVDWTRNLDQIEQALSKFTMPERGSTALYDACVSAIEKIGQGSNKKRILLALTDGQDTNSKQTYRYLRELVKRSEILTYCIHLSDPTDVLAGFGKSILEEFSKFSGGATYTARDKDDIRKVFEMLAIELRSQYRVGYRPANHVADGKWRSIKVKVNPVEVEDLSKPDRPRKKMELTARTRDGYYTLKNIK